jgi:hypothetical protein
MAVISFDNFRHIGSVAVLFWGSCLVLTGLEATVGANLIISGLFFVSIPVMVMGLLWANRSLLRSRERWIALATLAVSAFVYASIILLLGLLAASKLKALLLEA